MKRFDKKGMMIYPNPRKKESPCGKENVVVVEECYCQNGHSLIDKKINFDGFNGILFTVKRAGKEGRVAISPVYGCDHRISLDMDLSEGEIWDFHCPACDEALPYYTLCECGAYMTTFFTSKDADFKETIAICNRAGCKNAEIIHGESLLTDSMLDAL